MVVTLSGLIYILSAALALFQLKLVHGTDEKILATIGMVWLLAVGGGLILRQNWARWMALGTSLLSWTLGSLALIWALCRGLMLFLSSGPSALPLLVIGLLVWVVFGLLVWLSYRLYLHLTSHAGREEFRTPETEQHAVVKSTVLYIAWCGINLLVLEPYSFGGGRNSTADLNVLLGKSRRAEQRTIESLREEGDAYNARLAREREFVERQQLRERETLEAQQTLASDHAAEHDAPVGAEPTEPEARYRQPLESANPRMQSDTPRPQETASEPASSAILKCRDASGAISFTQAYCPAGTTRVESPPAD